MSGYTVARLDDIEEISDGRVPWRPIRHHFGITSFGANAWTGAAAGDRIINEHDEDDDHEELYLVHCGRATFELDGERVDAPAGTFVFAAPSVRRSAFAVEPETTIIALGGSRGRAYEPSGMELWAPVRPLYDEGRYAEAADATKELLAHEGADFPAILYNLACCESLAGRTDDAIEHLRASLQGPGAEQTRRLAAEDSDLDPLRDEPAFKELFG